MKRVEPFFVILLVLVACAPAAQVMPTASSLPPTATTIPKTAPTLTTAPTAILSATPFPGPEGAVKAADGSTVFVKEGKLWQLDAQGKAVEKDILNITFAKVLDAVEIDRQLNSVYYENSQELLKKALMPGGVSLSSTYKNSVEGFITASDVEHGVSNYRVVGQILDVLVVEVPEDIMPGGKKALVLSCGVVGADKPIPVVAGMVEDNGSVSPFLVQLYSSVVGVNPYVGTHWGPTMETPKDAAGYVQAFKGRRLNMDILASANPEKSKSYRGTRLLMNNPEYASLLDDSLIKGLAHVGFGIKEENRTKEEKNKPTSAGQVLEQIMTASENDESVGAGYLVDNSGVFFMYDKK